MFTRTDFGLANEHRFFGVDLVVYCEGVPQADNSASLDEAYWSNVFMKFGRHVHCKSSGSKTDLKALADRVIANKINTITIAMDRDYDDFTGNIKNHKSVVYSFGYSWENDALARINFRSVMSMFVTLRDYNQLERDFKEFSTKQSELLRRAFAIDLKYINHQKPLFDRNKPYSVLRVSHNETLGLDRRKIVDTAKSLGRFQSANISRETYLQSCGLVRFFGKCVARIFYHWFVNKSKKFKARRNIPYQAFMSIIIAQDDQIDSSLDRDIYYSKQLKTI